MLQRWWFRIYVVGIAALGALIIIPMFVTVAPAASDPVTSVESLNFYDASVPLESRLFVAKWLKLNKVTDVSADNITVRANSITDTTYRFDTEVYRNVSLIMDSKSPAVSYVVNVQIDPTRTKDAETTLSCPKQAEQKGSSAKCQEMLRI